MQYNHSKEKESAKEKLVWAILYAIYSDEPKL